jgi:Tfp pilus assembly protein PilF
VNLKRPLSLALMLGASCGLIGCKAPNWNLPSFGRTSGASQSAAPDVGQKKYEGLAQEFSGSQSSGDGTSSGLGGNRTPPKQNMFSAAWTKTSTAVSSAFATDPQYAATDDPTSLSSRPKKIGPEVYVAAGRLLENQGKLDDAAENYEAALKVAPRDITTLVSLSRLRDRQRKPQLAVQGYEQALQIEPKNALVRNDLGLCYARQGLLPESLAQLHKAVELQPKNAKYRNNLASVLVEAGHTDEAFAQLAAANPPAAAHFNLGYLLHQRGQTEAAVAQLQLALAADPNMAPARAILAQIGPAAPQMAAAPAAAQRSSYSAPAASASRYKTRQNTAPASGASQYSPPPQQQAPVSAPYYGEPTGGPSMSDSLRRISHEEELESPAPDLTVHIAPPDGDAATSGPVNLSISDDGESGSDGQPQEPSLLP